MIEKTLMTLKEWLKKISITENIGKKQLIIVGLISILQDVELNFQKEKEWLIVKWIVDMMKITVQYQLEFVSIVLIMINANVNIKGVEWMTDETETLIAGIIFFSLIFIMSYLTFM